MYYVALMTFILIFSSVTMVLAVDAGHNNKIGSFLHVVNYCWWGCFCRFSGMGMGKFHKGEYGALETKGSNNTVC